MGTVYTTGSWRPFPDQENAFLERWRSFAAWATERPGAGQAVLARDVRDPERFVSFIAWDSWAAMREWKTHPEFRPRMSEVQAHVDRFAPTEVEVVARCASGEVIRARPGPAA